MRLVQRLIHLGLAGVLVALLGTSFWNQAASAGAASGQVIRIGYFANLTHAPALIARQRALFEHYLPGVKIEYTVFSVGTAEVEALKGGALDVGYLGPAPAVSGYVTTKGSALQIVSGATIGGAKLVVRPNLIANAGAPTATEIVALAGKTIADPGLGGTQDIALRGFLKRNGLFAGGKPTVNIAGLANPDTLSQFQQGRIDGAWVPEPWATRLITEGKAKTFVDEKSLWAGGRFATTLLISPQRFEKAHPDLVAGVVKANQVAVDYLNNIANRLNAQRQIQARLLADAGKQLAPAVIEQAWTGLSFDTDPVAASVEANYASAHSLGLLSGDGNIRGIFNLDALNLVRAKQGLSSIAVPESLR